MNTTNPVKEKIFALIAQMMEDKSCEISDEMPLIGDESALDSMKLVELCLNLEDYASDLGFVFDWTSEMAMSKSRGMFRTAGALASEFLAQQGTHS